MDIQELRQNRTQGVVAYTNFTLLKEKHNRGIFCCFEGEDSKYYLRRVELITKVNIDNLIPFNCGGKSEVIRFYELIKKDKINENIKFGFFVDRDFDASIIIKYDSEIYETPCYSIENFYSTLDAFKRILKCEFQMNEAEKDYNDCLSLYLIRQREFHQHVKLLNAWLWCQKDLFNQGKAGRLNWDKFKLSKIVPSISLDKVYMKNYDVAKLEKDLFPDSTKVSPKLLQEKMDEIETKNYQSFFRGKFEVDFLYNFVMALKDEVTNKAGRFTKKNGTHINLSKSNILSELSVYACTPSCLYRYISKLA